LAGSSIAVYIANPSLHRVAGFISAGDGEFLDVKASYNEIGALFALVMVLGLQRLSMPGEHPIGRTFGLFGLLGVNFIGLLLTQSRSAALALVCGYVAVLLICRMSGRAFNILLLGGSALSALWFVIHDGLSINRFSESVIEESSAYTSMLLRFSLWDQSYQLWTDNPVNLFFGVGAKNMNYYLGAITSDSFFLDHLAAEGLIGLLFILALLVWPLWRLRGRGSVKPGENVAFLTLAVAMTVSITGNVLVDPYYGGITFLLLYGFSAAYWSTERV
jgi:hypothetical protein